MGGAPARATLVVALVLLLLAPGSASGQATPIIDPVGGPREVVPDSPEEVPEGFRRSAAEAIGIASRTEAGRGALARKLEVVPYARLGRQEWAVVYARGPKILLQVDVDDFSGRVTDVWDGLTADFPLARGEEHALGDIFYNPAVWLTFGLLFLVPFVDLRRPFRLLHLDLLVLLGFGVSHWFYERSDLERSVPLVYPVLAYLLARMLILGARPGRGRGPLVPHIPLRWVAVAAIVLAGARVALNLIEVRSVIDVGYVSVIGADRITHGEELYVFNDAYGDTYGPLAYLAYVPFELVFPYEGRFDQLWAAHAAAITFDLLTALALVWLGRSLRAGRGGTVLGVALAYAWLAYPYTLYPLLANPNDGLVALLLVLALLAFRSPAGRGLLLGAAALTKFAPAILLPLLARGRVLVPREAALAMAAFASLAVLLIGAFLPDGGLREFYDTTVGFQLGRESPFSPWGQDASLEPLKTVLTGAALLLAAGVGIFPRGRRTLAQVCALTAAVVISVQLPAIHWFYYYVVWFTPCVLAAIFAQYPSGGTRFSRSNAVLPMTVYRPIVGPDLSTTQKRRAPVLRRLTARVHSEQKGFTLIELLVVILIIGILAAIALPAFLGQRKKGQDSDAKSNARNLVSEVESCYATNEDYTTCDSTSQLGETGLPFAGVTGTPATGSVGIQAAAQAYTVIASSKSGNSFSIRKPASGATTRACGANNSAGCKNTNTW